MGETMHPARRLLTWLSPVDFALFDHGYLGHGRDYYWHIEDCLGSDKGRHEIVFTHCVEAHCRTRVVGRVWAESWDDVFTDYERWEAAGEPEGYVWGSNWSMAYPGLTVVDDGDSETAKDWSRRTGRPFHEVLLETDRFAIRLVFHGIRHRKVSGASGTLADVIIPIDGSKSFTQPPPP